MPIPLIPVVLGVASAVAGAIGVKKGLDAKKLYEQAKETGERAERRHRRAVKELEEKRNGVYRNLEALGQKKITVFESTAKKLLEIIKDARATAEIGEYGISEKPIAELINFDAEIGQMSSTNVAVDGVSSLALAGLGAAGVYGAVGALGTASTGTAIAGLSGAAATKATLAWLGGGSLATGGLGIAGGAWVLGGIVAGPALAITGFTLASQAEEALTKAEEYAAEVKQKIAELAPVHVFLDGLQRNIEETEHAIGELESVFSRGLMECRAALEKYGSFRSAEEKVLIEQKIPALIMVFKALKDVVQTPLVDESMTPVTGLHEIYVRKLEVANIPLLPEKE